MGSLTDFGCRQWVRQKSPELRPGDETTILEHAPIPRTCNAWASSERVLYCPCYPFLLTKKLPSSGKVIATKYLFILRPRWKSVMASDSPMVKASLTDRLTAGAVDQIAGVGSLFIHEAVELGSFFIFVVHMVRWLLTRLPRRESLMPALYQIGVLQPAGGGPDRGRSSAWCWPCRPTASSACCTWNPGWAAVINVSLRPRAGAGAGGHDARRPRRAAPWPPSWAPCASPNRSTPWPAMGANPIQYLVVPRFLGCLLLIPALTIMADFMGMIGGAFYCIYILNIDWHSLLEHSQEYVRDVRPVRRRVQEPVLRGGHRR